MKFNISGESKLVEGGRWFAHVNSRGFTEHVVSNGMTAFKFLTTEQIYYVEDRPNGAPYLGSRNMNTPATRKRLYSLYSEWYPGFYVYTGIVEDDDMHQTMEREAERLHRTPFTARDALELRAKGTVLQPYFPR